MFVSSPQQYDSEAMEDDGAPQQPQLTHVADHKEHMFVRKEFSMKIPFIHPLVADWHCIWPREETS